MLTSHPLARRLAACTVLVCLGMAFIIIEGCQPANAYGRSPAHHAQSVSGFPEGGYPPSERGFTAVESGSYTLTPGNHNSLPTVSGDLYPEHSESGYPEQRAARDDTLMDPSIADSIFLDEILIESTRLREPLSHQPLDVQLIDSLQLNLYRTMPVSAALSRYSSLFIRDNGPGGLATLSQRGLSAGQTRLLWEGFPINSLSVGLADLSVIPSGLFGSVEVSPGTPSSAFGGESLGGTVFLSSPQSHQQNRLDFTQSAGAFDTWTSQFRGSYDDDRWSLSIRGQHQQAENDYSYYNRATGQVEQRSHNAGRAGHLMGSAGYQFSQVRLHSTIWLFDSQNDIPGSILDRSPETVQSNNGLRWLGGMEAVAAGWKINARTFLEQDKFGYEDPPAGIDSRFTQERLLTGVDIRRPSVEKIVWQGGFSTGLERVQTNNYSDSRQRRQLGLRLNPEIRLSEKRLRFTPTARIDAYSDFGWVLSPSLGINLELVDQRLHVRGMASRDFNPPSFNDLYWVPGGNADLVPERSFKTEAGVNYLPRTFFADLFSLTIYRIWLDNGIYWYPDRERVWSPSNVEKVDAYGAEGRAEIRHRTDMADFAWNLGMDLRKSEIAAPRFPDDQSVGRQMRYVPEWSFRSDLTIDISPVVLHVNYRWTDHRYVTEDHTSVLDAYQILDAAASLEQKFMGADWHLRISGNNLMNERYEIIQWYPMPGRHMEFSVSVSLL